MELLSNKSDNTLDEIKVDINGRRLVDSSGHQEGLNIKGSKGLDLNGFKDNLAIGLFTPDKILKPNYRAPLLLLIDLEESLLPPIESLSNSTKKLYYVIVLTEEAELKKNINGDIGEQNVVLGKRIKKRLKAYIGFIADVIKD